MKNKRFGLSGLMAPLLFVITYVIMVSQSPEYSSFTKAVSELGSIDAPNKWLWNIFGYIIPGILIAFFSIGHFKSMGSMTKSKLPVIGIFFSGVLMSLSGIFPGDFDDRTSITMILHTLGSFGCYIFFLLGAFSYPKLMRKSKYWKSAVFPSLAFTWLTIVFGAWPFIFTQMPGIGQRIVFSLYFLWVGFNALKLYYYELEKDELLLT
ncbi:DUF998 domain-containing protein [Mongoliitalea lutea]|uniref:DUF998 domain-containing protein n=1 Tax=Mongoliitalea lutea TaxID=849756 RepID=A0A8J3CW52_9BACT|nr:DUF998 domain-containing protein [Mongoliitalea lutea]GHB32295.1 hypothetical protein GCM10008106_11600 [Mongoliitalea lutea]